MRHFEFTGEEKTIIARGGNNSKEVKVKRIRSTRDLKYLGIEGFTVHKGEIGGWIEEEDNIQGDNAWVADEAVVYDESTISDRALVCGESIVQSSEVVDRATVQNSIVYDCRIALGAKIENSELQDVMARDSVQNAFICNPNDVVRGYIHIESWGDIMTCQFELYKLTAYTGCSDVFISARCLGGTTAYTLQDFENEFCKKGKRYSAQYKMFVEMVKFQFGVI